MERELMIPIRSDVPPDFHPNVIRNHETPGGRLGADALAKIYESMGVLNDTEAEVTNKVALAKAAKPVIDRTLARAKTQVGQLGQQVEMYANEMNGKLMEKRNAHQAAEIRAHFKSLKGSFNDARQLVDDGDRDAVAAILGAPPFLSGMSRETHAALRQYAAQRFEPHLLANVETASDALTRVMKAAHDFENKMAKKMKEWQANDDSRALEKLK